MRTLYPQHFKFLKCPDCGFEGLLEQHFEKIEYLIGRYNGSDGNGQIVTRSSYSFFGRGKDEIDLRFPRVGYCQECLFTCVAGGGYTIYNKHKRVR